MRIFVAVFALVIVAASATTASAANKYLLPLEDSVTLDTTGKKLNDYIPPAEEVTTDSLVHLKTAEETDDSADFGLSGYEYRSVRRLKYRQRRDVSEDLPNDYMPPSEEVSTEAVSIPLTLKESEGSTDLGINGYEYKTVRRLRYRQRRDVSEDLPNEYLLPSEDISTEAVSEPITLKESEGSTDFGVNGYEYKTVRRLRYRQRRDVSEDPPNEYLPPSEEVSTEAATEPITLGESEGSTDLGINGYEYKTVRRLKYRQRRDVSEDLPNKYLPPSDEASTEAVSELNLEKKATENPANFGDNCYEYKTIRRLKYRQRRDVSEDLPNEYLPPSEDVSTEDVSEPLTLKESEGSTDLGVNGYEYKTVRRLRYRQRRDVSEDLPNEYLPPSEDISTEAVSEPITLKESEGSTDLGVNGYEYKTVRRLKYRQRRDVSEDLPNEYLPPSDEASTEAVSELNLEKKETENSANFGDNGYEYKTVRRLKYRL